jgi:uncharacterized protein YfkK (UPF0435 family)
LKVTKKCDLLKKDETRRQEEQAEAGLTAREYQEFHCLKLPAKLQLLRQDILEKEETTDGEYEVDITRYFKLMMTRQSLRKNREETVYSSNKIVQTTTKCVPVATLRCNDLISRSGKGFHQLVLTTTRSDDAATTIEI